MTQMMMAWMMTTVCQTGTCVCALFTDFNIQSLYDLVLRYCNIHSLCKRHRFLGKKWVASVKMF